MNSELLMNKRFVRNSGLALAAVLLIAGYTPASAQRTRRPPPRQSAITVSRGSAAIAPFVGYLITPAYFSGPLNTSIGTSGAPLYGAALSVPLAPTASIVGTAGYSSGSLRAGIPFIGGYDFGSASTWVFDASVELRADNLEASGVKVIPFAQLGGGALRREVGISGLKTHSTDFTVSGGLGINIPLSASSDIQLLAKDYYGKADFGSIGSLNVSSDDIHTVGLTGGIRIGF
jgi:hypothetical protein